MPRLIDLLRPQSVVDIGCGVGSWLAEFIAAGVTDVRGFDFHVTHGSTLEVPAAVVHEANLGTVLPAQQVYSVALCLEVAEHLPPERADSFVAELTGLAPICVFSAAVPGQGGAGHLNEQWPAYWRERFAANGFVQHDILRASLWEEPMVAWWYAQNLFIYADPTAEPAERLHAAAARAVLPERIVHPGLLARPPSLREVLHAALPSAGRALRRRATYVRDRFSGLTG